MARKVSVPFAVQEGAAGVTQNSRESLTNMYAEVGTSGRASIVRRQRPGLRSVETLSGQKRCIERHKGDHYLIVGATLYKFDGQALTTLGTLSSVGGRCTMIFNDNDQIMISDGSQAYYYNGAVLQTVELPDEVTCGELAYLGGYGIFNVPGTGKFYITAANDFSAVDALDFATAESSPDVLVRVFVDHNELWLAGRTSTEVWQLTGGSDFPFTSLTNAQLERGCASGLTYAAEDNTVFFLGDDLIVYRADGYRPLRVSSHAIEEAIAGVTQDAIDNAYALIYTWRGSKFYTLTFPGELTVQLNIGTGLWNRVETFGKDWWIPVGSAGHVSDYLLTPSGICELAQLNQDEGDTMRRGGVSAPGYADGKRIIIHSFFLDAEVGRAGIGKDANVMMRIARDGESFGNIRTRSLGPTGAYNRRAMWRNLGMGRKPTIEFFVTDDVEFTIIGSDADITVAAS